MSSPAAEAAGEEALETTTITRIARFRLTIAYDGRPFLGWQSQPHGNTVQDCVEAALASISGGTRIPIHGSGRTDTGVHALGQVAHFDAPEGSRMTERAWLRALNAILPLAIRVLDCAPVAPPFHSRFDAVGKTYLYRIWHGPLLPPHEAGLAWHHPRPFDLSLLETALARYQGTHDFARLAAFRGHEDRDNPPDTTRTIHATSWTRSAPTPFGHALTLEFNGSGFLYKMVRLLTGSALRVASGQMPLAELEDYLSNPQKSPKSHHCAPADGLTLHAVHYPTS